MRRLLTCLPLLAVAALVQSCATPSAQPEASYRVVNRTEIRLGAGRYGASEIVRRTFEQRDIEGWVTHSGQWAVEGVVNHTRFRCGTYEIGIQLGQGVSACSQPTWLMEPEYGTRERQCNSASMIHSGGGRLPLSREQVAQATCVRILVRCSGACG